MGRALERVCVAPDHKIILSTKIRINQVEMCYRIPVDMTDSESFIAIDELKFSERQASSSPKLFFSAECLKNSWTFSSVSFYGGQNSSSFETIQLMSWCSLKVKPLAVQSFFSPLNTSKILEPSLKYPLMEDKSRLASRLSKGERRKSKSIKEHEIKIHKIQNPYHQLANPGKEGLVQGN